ERAPGRTRRHRGGHRGQREARARVRPGPRRARLRRGQRRPRAAAGGALPLRAGRPGGLRPDARGLRGRRRPPRPGGRGGPPGRDPGTRDAAERRDLPPQHAEHLQRLRGRPPARDPQRRVGVERDGPGPALRHPAARDPARRVPSAAPRERLLALQGRGGGDGAPLLPLGSRDEDARVALLERHGPRGVPRLPGLRRRSRAAPLEPVGLHRRARRRAGRAAGAPGGRHGGGGLRDRQRRHGHDAPERRAGGRHVSRRAVHGHRGSERHAAGDRQGPQRPGLRARALLARHGLERL
ncbi:MAG: UDP-glucose 4-epimerase, partial [uncultured Solirubrobacteraceae bacterium]